MDKLMLFIDGSVNVRSKIGYGACLAVSDSGISLEQAMTHIKVKRFMQTSSTKLELQTLLWALGDHQVAGRKVVVYTDSQNIMGLPGRRHRLVQNNYRSKKNRCLNNSDLYREFFTVIDALDCEFVKVRGHRASNRKDGMDRLFTLVDRASRKALREGSPRQGRGGYV